jgi:hypothetical protein
VWVIGDGMIEQIKAVQLAQRVKAWDLAVVFLIKYSSLLLGLKLMSAQQDINLSGFHYIHFKICV